MTSILNFKDIIDTPKWRFATRPVISVGNGTEFASDLRNNEDRNPFVYWIRSTNSFWRYNPIRDQWFTLLNPNLGSGPSGCGIASKGPSGTIAAGATASSIPLTTALPAAVGINQLANRGDNIGFKVRIIGNAAGSSGKTEERIITGNTGGTTPTLTFDNALSFVPILGDAYEFFSGRMFMLGANNAAGSWKYYDILTESMSGNLATANLPAAITDSDIIPLSEQFVPYDRKPGDGFFGNLIATATGATSITGQASGGDAGVLADMHRNFQIRIVKDTAIPTAVGQRRNITTHTAGPSPVYTVPAWSVQPSATATYVIENNDDYILAFIAGQTNTFTYSVSGNAWSTATFGARAVAPSAGQMGAQSFSIEPDPGFNARHSFIYSFRSSGAATLDVLDIAGAATGTWSSDIVYGNKGTVAFGSGSCSIQDSATKEGRYMHLNLNSITTFYRFDMKNRVLESGSEIRGVLTSLNAAGNKLIAHTTFVDGTSKLTFLYFIGSPDATNWQFFTHPVTS
jgi:hypothetical protein